MLVRCFVLSICMLSLNACSSLGVQPYQREVLAKEEMLPVSDRIAQDYDDHIYFSKEASSGGGTFAGGGCGCN